MKEVAAETIAVLAMVLLPSAAAGTREVSVANGCRVSNTFSHPVPGRPSFNFGSARIAVAFPQDARFLAVPDGSPGWAFIQKNGWIRAKLGWFTTQGRPTITGGRVGGTARPLRADVGALTSAPDGPFYPSLLYFSSFGCWRITVTAGGATLKATVDVVRSTDRR